MTLAYSAPVRANPEKSDRAIAADIGVDHKTVAAARKEITGEKVRTVTETLGDGRTSRCASARRRPSAGCWAPSDRNNEKPWLASNLTGAGEWSISAAVKAATSVTRISTSLHATARLAGRSYPCYYSAARPGHQAVERSLRLADRRARNPLVEDRALGHRRRPLGEAPPAAALASPGRSPLSHPEKHI
jgi:hypothetical protein